MEFWETVCAVVVGNFLTIFIAAIIVAAVRIRNPLL